MNKKLAQSLDLLKTPLNPSVDHIARVVEISRASLETAQSPVRTKFKTLLSRQIRYITPQVWILTALLLIVNYVCLQIAIMVWPSNVPLAFCLFGAVMPFGCLPQFDRAVKYRMYELEQSTVVSSNRIMVTRLIIIGIITFLVLLPIVLKLGTWTGGVIRVLPYLMLSYLVVCFGWLSILNLRKGKPCVVICSIFAGVVLLTAGILYLCVPVVFNAVEIWVLLCVVFFIGISIDLYVFFRSKASVSKISLS